MQVNLATNLLEARAKSGLVFEDKEHKKKRSKRRSKKDGGSRSNEQKHQTSNKEDQQSGPAYLEVLVQEVEQRHDGDQERQGKGLSHNQAWRMRSNNTTRRKRAGKKTALQTKETNIHQMKKTKGGSAYLEVLVQEVEEQQDGDQEGQGKGRCHPNQNDGGHQLQATAQEEGREVCQVLVHI